MARIIHLETQPNQRQFIYAVKAFAILSVICAHVASVSKLDSVENVFIGNVLTSIGSIGVAIFFMVSGFLFASNNYSIVSFLKKRITSIVIPWFVTGSAVYFYVAIRKKGINVIDWLNFILGNKSYLYFLPILISCYLISFWINKNHAKFQLVMILSLISIFLTTSKVISPINPYMNPLNWFFYFGLGYLVFKLDLIFTLLVFARKTIFIWSVIFLFLVLMFSAKSGIGYWSNEYLFFELTSLVCICGICSFQRVYESKAISLIGKESFSIYLLHMPFAGLVTNLFFKIDCAVITLIRPFVVLFLTVTFIRTCLYISRKLKIDRFFHIFIGSRE